MLVLLIFALEQRSETFLHLLAHLAHILLVSTFLWLLVLPVSFDVSFKALLLQFSLLLHHRLYLLLFDFLGRIQLRRILLH